jgi:uncharacterized protein YndB with AHSA1/START domain
VPNPDATMREERGRTVLRFERLLRHPPQRVWEALTEAEELPAWHPTPYELERAAGETVRYSAAGDVPEMNDGVLTDWDPPRLLGHSWGEDHLRWELNEHDEGCLLTLTHSFGNRFKAARDAAGWHLCLEALSAYLDGASTASAREILGGGWQELNSAYEERFGIPPDKATPPLDFKR